MRIEGLDEFTRQIGELANAVHEQNKVHAPIGRFFDRAATSWDWACGTFAKHRLKIAAAAVAAMSPSAGALVKLALDAAATAAHVKTSGG